MLNPHRLIITGANSYCYTLTFPCRLQVIRHCLFRDKCCINKPTKRTYNCQHELWERPTCAHCARNRRSIRRQWSSRRPFNGLASRRVDVHYCTQKRLKRRSLMHSMFCTIHAERPCIFNYTKINANLHFD